MNKRILGVFGVLALFFVMYATPLIPLRVGFNHTESLPMGFYLTSSRISTLEHGDLACFGYKAPDWAKSRSYFYEGYQICKHVMGVPGDSIEQVGKELFITHKGVRESAGVLISADSKGRSVAQLNWGTSVIPSGQVYLGSVRIKNSFDSRYLGLIPTREVVAKIYPLLVF